MNDDTDNLTWTIEGGEGRFAVISSLEYATNDRTVYEQVLTTTFKFTPIVLDHHVPCKVLPDGRM